MTDDYPDHICGPCGHTLGRKESRWSTWHHGRCGWCGAPANVTEPRDFGYPPAPAATTARGDGRKASPLTDPDTPVEPTAGASAHQGRPVETSRSRPSPENV